MAISMRRAVLATALFAACHGEAFCNAGTALMWAALFHLTIGNLVIGALEAAILCWVFKSVNWRALLATVPANYLSMAAGVFAVGAFRGLFADWLSGPYLFIRLREILPYALVVPFIATLIIEWPFFYIALRRLPGACRKSIMSCLLANVISYALLTPLYLSTSPKTLVTETELETSPAFTKNVSALIYYISTDYSTIRRIHPNGQGDEEVCTLAGADSNSRLVAVPMTEELVQLWMVHYSQDKPPTMVLEVPGRAVSSMREGENLLDALNRLSRDFRRGMAYAVSPDKARWSVYTGVWAADGIAFRHEGSNVQIRLAFETPFLQLVLRNVTLLPHDELVFSLENAELAGSHIALLEMNSRRLVVITRGHDPAVVLR